jgi:hypothetical protein
MLIDIYDEDDMNFSELHQRAFNEDCYIIGYYQASQWLKEHDICAFDAIDEVIQYEKNNFGNTSTDINSEAIVNMYVYIKGEELLSGLEVDLHDCTREELIAELKKIKDKR